MNPPCNRKKDHALFSTPVDRRLPFVVALLAGCGTIVRTDGTNQVTFNGHPVYYYAKDANPGDTTGQKVGGVWFVIDAHGNPIGV